MTMTPFIVWQGQSAANRTAIFNIARKLDHRGSTEAVGLSGQMFPRLPTVILR